MYGNDVDDLTILFREMMGQKLAICPNISSSSMFFVAAVLRETAGTPSPSSVRPRNGEAADFLRHVHSGAMKGAKLPSSDKIYIKF